MIDSQPQASPAARLAAFYQSLTPASLAVLIPRCCWIWEASSSSTLQAPTAGSVVLAAVLLKMGGYGFLRFSIPLLPDAAVTFGPIIIGLAIVAIIYGGLVAMVQPDLKKLVAYSSVSHMGFVMLGLFAGNEAGVQGSILQMLKLPDGTVKVLVEGNQRARLEKFVDNPDFFQAEAALIEDDTENGQEPEAATPSLVKSSIWMKASCQ